MESNKTDQPLVSIILPAYNAERYIAETIDSILAQTYTNYEFIIINDGSSDKTEDIVLSYTDPRIRYVKNEQNLKLIKTLNKGIDLAKGEYIARMDADDISHSTRLEEELNFLQENPNIDVVSCFPNNIDSNGNFLSHSSYFLCTSNGACRFVAMIEPPILHPGVMFRTEVIRKYKYNDAPEYHHIEAYELWWRMIHDGVKCAMIPHYLLDYRDNPQSVCHEHAYEQWSNHFALLKRHFKEGIEHDVDEKYIRIITRKYTNSAAEILFSFKYLDKIKSIYVSRYKYLTSLEKKEINSWIIQRKLAILLSSMLGMSISNKFRAVALLLSNFHLLFHKNSIVYITNRIRRIRNEKK